MENKAFGKILWISLALFAVYTITGLFARASFLDKSKPFTSWTYDSKNSALNVWTSWDSGFYYDLAKNGYPKVEGSVKTALIDVPAGRWTKVFLGGGLVGDKRYQLPHSSEFSKVNNVLVLVGKPYDDTKVPVFYGYSGIPYCTFEGSIDYERDIQPSKEALADPTACGTTSCDKTYITYYSAEAGDVLFQESFSKESSSSSVKTFGIVRPSGFVGQDYRGLGCKSVGERDIVVSKSLDPTKQFTAVSFGPLYPWLSRLVAFVFSDIVASGLILSLVFTIMSGIVLYKLLSSHFSEKASMMGVLLYLLFPLSFFNYAFLPVSLFNFLFLSTLFYAERKSGLALLTIALLCLTSYYGVLVLIPLWFMIRTSDKNKFIPLVVVVCASLFFNFSLVASATGDSMGMITGRMPWWGASSPLGGLINYFVEFTVYKAFEVTVIALLCAVMYWIYSKKLLNQEKMEGVSLYVLPSLVLLVMFHGSFTGTLKYFIFSFPMFALLGVVSENSPKYAKVALIISFILGLVLMTMWTISSSFVV